MKTLVAINVLFCTAMAAHCAVVITDDDFLDSDWTQSKIRDTTGGGTASFSVMQELASGNPGAFQQGIHQVPPNSEMFVTHILDGAFNSATSGTIITLEIAFDFEVTQVTIGSGVSAHFLIEQGGDFFVGPLWTFFLGAGWTPYGGDASLVENEFSLVNATGINAGIQPDFSGGPIQFGYLSRNNNLAGSPIQTTWGIDNFSVTINNIPEPSHLALGAMGAFALLLTRRRG